VIKVKKLAKSISLLFEKKVNGMTKNTLIPKSTIVNTKHQIINYFKLANIYGSYLYLKSFDYKIVSL
jgi:hypothetical protein